MGFLSNLFGRKEKFEYEELHDFSDIRNDMHSHFLFGIDDGAKSLDDSIEMIKVMKEMGYKKLITTPHVMADTYRNTPAIINEKLAIVREKLKEENVDIEIYAAAEYYCDHEFFHMISNEELLTISSEKHLLFEVSYLNAPEIFDDVVFALQSNGYRPILAHPERYPFWFNNFDKFMADYGKLETVEQIEKLHSMLRPHFLRRMKDEVEFSIPPLKETVIEVGLTSIQ
jgi:tyrosine-protein phosphatase YwqE